MRSSVITGVLAISLLMTGCVTKRTYTDTLAELDAARKMSAKTAAALDEARKDAAAREKAQEEEKAKLAQELAAGIVEAKNQARDLQTRLQAEQSKVVSLQEDKQKLLSGTTTAQDEIARLQKRAGELETDAARVKDLEKQLSERDQEIGTLSRTAADRAALAAKLEQERVAKEAEIQRLTKTHDDLAKSLQDQIAKGDIKIKQVRDRLTINMVDRVLFDSGQAQVKPAGLDVLKQVSDVLKKVTDKQIRIEGHTDNVPIGVKLREKFPTNWELSTARATSVVRYLIEEGGVDRATIAAGGYADTQLLESNETEAGKAANRRIEIVLYPKDLGGIAGQLK